MDPEGGKTVVTWDLANRNVTSMRKVAKSGSGLADLLTSATYNCTYRPSCAKPTSITDPSNAVANYTYDPVHGGILSEMQPAPANGAARPLKLYSYAQRYAWVDNGAGTLVPASVPVWVLTGNTVCQSAAGSSSAVCDGAAVQTVTTCEFGASGTAQSLLVKGQVVSSGGTALRTCYTYDTAGRKLSETRPLGTGATCP